MPPELPRRYLPRRGKESTLPLLPQILQSLPLAVDDAPEKRQPFGNASRKKLRELVSGKEVRVEFEKYDRYGRIVGKVLVTPIDCPTCGKTLDVGLAQITTGMAWWFRRYANEQSPEDQGRYEFAEQEAKAKKVGLWQDKNPIPPWEFRHPPKQ